MRPVRGREAWDRVVLDLPAPHVLQCYDWGALKARWGWSVARFKWVPAGRLAAAAQVLVRPVGGLPVRVGYVAKGPLLARPEDPDRWSLVLADLEAWARRERLVLLKIDPDVPAGAESVRRAWSERGWRPSAEQIQFPNTMVSDLSLGEDALSEAMKPKARYNIRLAGRRGVVVRHGSHADLDAFYALYAETGVRGGFAIRARPYYVDAWSTFLKAGRATVILAEREGVPLAGVIPVAFGPTTWFLYGASATAGREHMPAYAAQWESLRWAVSRGCRHYDWWGGPTVLDERDPLWGVYRFKRGFGAAWVEQLGAWDFPVRPVLFALFGRLARLRRTVLARRRSPGPNATR